MGATQDRDHVCDLAKRDSKKAHAKARRIKDPWFRAQALSWVVRFTDGNPRIVAKEAAKAAQECDDAYKRTAVRAWEIAALAERSLTTEARAALKSAIGDAKSVEPISSRSEALMLLLQAAFALGRRDAVGVYDRLKTSCPEGEHWRCKRAIRDGQQMLLGDMKPRRFFV